MKSSKNSSSPGLNKLWGREAELQTLEHLLHKKTSSLIVISERRRIGKSALVIHFAQRMKKFVQFQGLPPREAIDNQAQLNNFARSFSAQFNLPQVIFNDWSEAFLHLAKEVRRGQVALLLDEISWMGKYDPDFPGKLKIAWDTLFSRNDKLLLFLCGSVSTWIEQNILNHAGFVGRVSQVIRLGELDFKNCATFWGTRAHRISALEKLRYLSVSGGIPKYLEELDATQSVDDNIKRLCFTPGGYLLEDFDRIFSDIFGKRSAHYLQILKIISHSKLTATEIARSLGTLPSGDLTKHLADLEVSGFIARDYLHDLHGQSKKLSRYRIKDNYLRFYLKYIEPNLARIQNRLFKFNGLGSMLNWDTICGLQFENLVLSRIPEILDKLALHSEQILAAGPFFQNAGARKKACQVDLMIISRRATLYVCEIKFQKRIGTSVIQDVERKLQTLKVPRLTSLRPVLIYAGELEPEVIDQDYFDRILNVETMVG